MVKNVTTENTPPSKVKYPPGKNPNSLKTLTPFKPGHPGNPDPPEKGFQVSRRLKRMLEENSHIIPPNANPNDKKYAEQIARQMLVRSAQGDSVMVKEVLDRTEGKVPGDGAVINFNEIKILVIEAPPPEQGEGLNNGTDR